MTVVVNPSIAGGSTGSGGGGGGGGTTLGPYATVAALQAAYPAATNNGASASVGSAAPYVRYVSNGTSWVAVITDPGTQTLTGGGTVAVTHATHANKIFYINSSSPTTLAFSNAATGGYGTGDSFYFGNEGTGVVTVTGVVGGSYTVAQYGYVYVQYFPDGDVCVNQASAGATTGPIVVTGGTAVGSTLTATVAAGWSTTGNWTRNGTNISGATGLSYTTVTADGGNTVTFATSYYTPTGVAVVASASLVYVAMSARTGTVDLTATAPLDWAYQQPGNGNAFYYKASGSGTQAYSAPSGCQLNANTWGSLSVTFTDGNGGASQTNDNAMLQLSHSAAGTFYGEYSRTCVSGVPITVECSGIGSYNDGTGTTISASLDDASAGPTTAVVVAANNTQQSFKYHVTPGTTTTLRIRVTSTNAGGTSQIFAGLWIVTSGTN